MKALKLARPMEAWQIGQGPIPEDVRKWIIVLPSGDYVLISPRAGSAHGPGTRAGIVCAEGWWIIRAETGCLYAVTDEDFRKKYAVLGHDLPPTPVPAAPRPGAFH